MPSAARAYFKCECGHRFRSTLTRAKRRRFCPLCKLEIYDLYRVPSQNVGRPFKWRRYSTFINGKLVIRRERVDGNCQISQASSPMPDSGVTKSVPPERAEDRRREC